MKKDLTDKYPELARDSWLRLFHYFQHEYDEGEITPNTYESMTEELMVLKNYLPEERHG